MTANNWIDLSIGLIAAVFVIFTVFRVTGR